MRRAFAPVLALLAVFVTLAGARVWLRAGDGLPAQYFTNIELTPPEAFRATDAVPTADAARSQWYGQVPAAFSVRWTGYLAVSDPATYEFALMSDDASWLFVDGQNVVSNPGDHDAITATGTVALDRGPHRVTIEYVQNGGAMALDWSWTAAGSGARAAVPWWRLSKRPATPASASGVRALSWLMWLTGGLIAVLGVRATLPGLSAQLTRRPAESGFVITWRAQAGWLAFFLMLVVIETWPLVLNPGHMGRHDNADTILNEWTIAWVAHQAPRDIVHLFDANTFYPTPNILAYSEALLVQAAFAAPLLWLGASPVLAFNIVLMLGLALSGWAMCLVVARWTHDWIAGASAGIIFGFSAALLTRLPHLQALHVEFIPPMLWALDRLMQQPNIRRGVALALWFSLQALTSYYLLVITAFGLAAASLGRIDAWRARARQIAFALVVAAGVAAVVLSPFLFQYWKAHQNAGMTRPLTDQLETSWRDYVTTPSRLDQVILAPLSGATGLFPGFGGLLLALYAISRGALTQGRARMCLAFGIAGAALSFGPDLPGYAWLHRVVVPLQGIRAPARFGLLLTVAVAVLAGLGLADLRRRLRTRAALILASALIPLVLVAESLAAPLAFRRFDRIPAIYGRLANEPNAIVAELPMPPGSQTALNAPSLRNSTASWYRLVNGYSGFVPETYWRQARLVADFPSASALDALKSMGVTHLFVHRRAIGARAAELAGIPALTLIAEEGDIALYRLR